MGMSRSSGASPFKVCADATAISVNAPLSLKGYADDDDDDDGENEDEDEDVNKDENEDEGDDEDDDG